MKLKPRTDSPLLATAAAVVASAASAADQSPVSELIANIKCPDDAVRGAAWQGAGKFGAPAVKPLAGLMQDPEMETARSAKRALWKIVRHAGRPGAGAEQKAVVTELIPLLANDHTPTRREVLWMLSEIGGDEAVPAVAALFSHPELREDARAALERIHGNKSLAALKSALAKAPEDYKPAIAVSLRARGVTVKGYPSQKLVPTKKTGLEPATGSQKTL